MAMAVHLDAARRNIDRIGINFSELPQEPFWAPLFGRSEVAFKTNITAKIMAGSALLGRQLTQPEKDALAQHYAQLLRTQCFDSPIALVAGYAFYRRTRASYGFPLYTPKAATFNPNKLLWLEGPFAQRAWHGLRMLAWYSGCRIVTGIFCLSYAISVHESAYATDPRLQDYRREATARQQQLLRQRAAQAGQRMPPSPQAKLPPRTAPQGDEQSYQDAQDAQVARDARDAQTAQSAWPGMQSSQGEGSQASFSDEPYVFDDASPVSTSEQQISSTRQQVSQGGSAWDRVRRQAGGGPQNQTQSSSTQASSWGSRRDNETAAGAQQGSSYSFSSAEEERAYAKEQAQKEFDEMLERERQGASDNSRRRW